MSKEIKKMYKKAGIEAPDGKGIHTRKFHALAIKVKKGNPEYTMDQAYATAMEILGRNKAVKKSHWR
jgi:hypothetical protein